MKNKNLTNNTDSLIYNNYIVMLLKKKITKIYKMPFEIIKINAYE